MIPSGRQLAAATVTAVMCTAAAAPATQAASAASTRAWRITTILPMSRDADLLTIAALSRHDAWTFGQDGTGKAIALRWHGSTWSRAPVRGMFARVGSVSATGPGNLWVTGTECGGGFPPGPSGTYVARYNGRSWKATRFPAIAGCRGTVATTGRSNGWLFGDEQALHFTGRHWHKLSLPILKQVLAATAVSAKDIWTIDGWFPHPFKLYKSKVFFAHFNGRAWRTVPFPAIRLPRHGYLYPFDIEAASASSIWASVTIEPAASHSFLLHWNGAKWHAIPLPATPYQLLQVTPDGNGGAWAIMFQSVTGESLFAHYSGRWTFQPVPTAGLPGLQPGSETFDVYALSRFPGTRSLLASGDVFYQNTKNATVSDSLIFRYGT